MTKDLAEGDLNVWAEASARSSVYRNDLAEKFKGTRELDLITRHPYYKEKYGFVPADSVPESVSWGLEMATMTGVFPKSPLKQEIRNWQKSMR